MPDTRPVTDKDLVVTRSFAAPVATLWKFWTEPELLGQWYGPIGCTTLADKSLVEPHVGGAWNVTIRNDETGDEFPIIGRIVAFDVNEYLEIEAIDGPQEEGLEDNGLQVTFHDDGDSCRVTLRQGQFNPQDMIDAREQWDFAWDKVDGLLAA